MNRKEFMLLSSSAAALFANGMLPLLGAEKKQRRKPKRGQGGRQSGTNIFTEPPAIEPVTGYLGGYKPTQAGSMEADFKATYALVQSMGSGTKSRTKISGSLEITLMGKACTSVETRQNSPANVVKTELLRAGKLNAARKWTLTSSVQGNTDLTFKEAGTCDGKTMTVKAKSWDQSRKVSNPLISQWALLPLLAAGKLKDKPLTFDMLDNSTLRANQTLTYTGEIEVPVAGGKVACSCYAQTGYGILPIHYLVDKDGRVQLITQETVSWALTKLV